MMMKKNVIIILIAYSATLSGQDVPLSLAVDVAAQYYERVKNDFENEHINNIKTANQTKSERIPKFIALYICTNIPGI